MLHKVRFHSYDCHVKIGRYKNNDRKAIILVDEEDGSEVAIATINLMQVDIPKDHVLIKSYSENEGMLEALIKHKIVSPSIKQIQTGFVSVDLCKLLIEEDE